MDRIPFGVSQFDSLIGGGSPPGSVVLLAGDAGAGTREFAYTSTVINALGDADSDLFELHYGSVDSRSSLPDEIHYVSFTANESEIVGELTHHRRVARLTGVGGHLVRRPLGRILPTESDSQRRVRPETPHHLGPR